MPAAPGGPGSRNLVLRVAAAAVLVPLALVCAYVGSWLWTAIVTIAATGLYIEWLMVVGASHEMPPALTGLLALLLIGGCLGFARPDAALLAAVLGLAAVALLSSAHRVWTIAGLIYAGAAQFSAVLVRLDPEFGFAALTFVLLVVWATDSGGYFVGRRVGGPKLWPRVSPNKTWAGAVGGFVGSLAVAGAFAGMGFGRALPLMVLSGVLSVAGQLGDLLESAVKRRFGVKDSSRIIPGHGGLLDRLDSLVAALVLAAVLGLVRHGVDGIGRGLMVW